MPFNDLEYYFEAVILDDEETAVNTFEAGSLVVAMCAAAEAIKAGEGVGVGLLLVHTGPGWRNEAEIEIGPGPQLRVTDFCNGDPVPVWLLHLVYLASIGACGREALEVLSATREEV